MKLAIILFTVIGLTIFASSMSDAYAAVDMFLKIPGVDGESTSMGHEREIEILAWSWGASQTGTASTGGGAGAGKASFQDFHFTKFIDKSSPILLQKLAIGQHIPDATFVIERPTGDKPFKFLEIKMTDILVSSYQIGGSSGDNIPVENISLNFAKIEFKYTPQKADGTPDTTVRMCYDLKTATTC